MTRARIATLCGIGLALACGVITIPNVPFAPSNTCATTDDCSKAFPDASVTCTSGACTTGNAFRPIVVVSVPSTIAGIGGRTFALPDSYLLQQALAPAGCGNIPASATCVFMPPLATISNGWLLMSNGVGRALWPPNGLRPNMPDTNPTTLPQTTVFHPMWVDPVTNIPLLATKLGLPLPDILAAQSVEFFGQPLLLAPTNGTDSVQGFVFSATLPQAIAPTDPSRFYAFESIPNDPFSVFPPLVRPLSPRPKDPPNEAGVPDPTWQDGLAVANVKAGLAPINLNLLTVPLPNGGGLVEAIPTYDQTGTEPIVPLGASPQWEVDDPGAPSLEGWSVYINDVDGRRVSGTVTLGAGAKKFITLSEAPGMTSQVAQTLYIAPPPSIDAPRYISVAAGGIITNPFIYPPLPHPAAVSGSVVRGDALTKATSAHVTFVADGSTGATLIDANSSAASLLSYQKLATTDGSGSYTTLLPPGGLRAYVVPDDPELALTVINSVTVTTDPVQAGKTLVANLRTHVKGRIVLADGSPLYAAEVVISTSTDQPFAPSDDPLAHPRDSHGFTDVNGNFDVPSDPGQVDVSIRPQDGTRYPWIVLTNRAVLANVGGDAGVSVTVTIPQITVPIPTSFPPTAGVLTDSLGNPLGNTIVSAYAFPPAAATPDGGIPLSRGARLIGQTVSDASGNFQLFLAPPDSE